jgi:hypothetical protein
MQPAPPSADLGRFSLAIGDELDVAAITGRLRVDGFVVLSGPAASRLDDLGAAIGTVVPQSPRGELVEDVRDYSDVEPADGRGYRAGGELPPHSDPPTLLALHCLQPARAGGHSHLVSVQSIHDRIAETDPRALAVLYQPFPQWRVAGMYGEPDPGPDHVDRPVFATRDGVVSCAYYRPYIELAAVATGQALREEQVVALDLFDRCAGDPSLGHRFQLPIGHTLVLHNRRVLHARTDYEDWSDRARRRHLRRIWIDAPDHFPADPRHEFGDLFAPGVG